MTDFSVLEYLASKGLHGRQTTGNEWAFPCFMDCGESPDSRKRKWYIDAEDGWFWCHVCQSKGGTYLLQKHFGDEVVRDQPAVDFAARRKILTAAAEVGASLLEGNDDQLHYLFNRGLSAETIVERQFGWVGPLWSLVGGLNGVDRSALRETGLVWKDGHNAGQDYFTNHLLIPYQTRGSVVQIRGRVCDTDKSEYRTAQGDAPRIYNIDALTEAEDVVVCEGELDCAILAQHLSLSPDDKARKIGVVAFPGVTSKPANWESMFAKHRRVYIGFDSDDAGRRAAVKIKDVLGARCRILEWPTDLVERAAEQGIRKIDWTEAFTRWGWTWHDVMAHLGNAAGKRLSTVAEAGMAFQQQSDATPGFKLGFAQLDATIEPGLKLGQVMIPLSKTGVGKTIFLCNVTYNMRAQHILFMSLEMTREEVFERLERIYLFHHPRASRHDVYAAYTKVAICDENRVTESSLRELIDEYILEHDAPPEVLLVDYLGYYARGAKGNSPYEKTSAAVMALKAIAKGDYGNGDRGPKLAVIAPHQVNRLGKEGKPLSMDDSRDSGVVEETADFLLALFRPDDAINIDGALTGKIRLQILKSRHGGKDRVFSLQMGLLSLAIVDDDTPAAKRAFNENYLLWRGSTYRQYRAEQTKPIQTLLELA